MKMQTYFPTPLLDPFVKSYLVIETAEETINRVLPDTSAVMAFRLRGSVQMDFHGTTRPLDPLVVSGLRKSGRNIHYGAGTVNLLVIFKAGGITPFLREPLHLLSEASVAMDCLDGFRNMGLLEEQLAEMSSHTDRIRLIEQFLTRLIRDTTADKLILTAIEKIRNANGQVKIRELADSLYISQDVFEKRFRRIAGASPIHTALEAGYFDQPHFNKDFKLFTGRTPSEFLKSPVFW